MEHSQANIDALRSDNEEADSRMFVHVSHAIEFIHQEELLHGT